MSRTETIIWTALPNGIASAGHVNLSAFVSPQLETNEGGQYPLLTLFPDFADWVMTLMNQEPAFRFTVTFQNAATLADYPAVTVLADLAVLSDLHWRAIFNPEQTGVTSHQYQDYSKAPIHSFNVNGVQDFVSSVYGQLGVASPLLPPVLTTDDGVFAGPSGNDSATEIYTWLRNLTECAAQQIGNPTGGEATTSIGGDQPSSVAPPLVCNRFSGAIGEARAFHNRPPYQVTSEPFPTPAVSTAPLLDFHQAVSSLGSYPAVLRQLGLVFDLVVPLPAGLPNGAAVNVSVVPSFTSAFKNTSGPLAQKIVNVSPPTNATLSKAAFRPVPRGPDYGNGMLDLADTSRFSIVDLDVDGASEQLYNLSTALQNIQSWVLPEDHTGQTMAMTVPALRSSGPQIVWSGWAGSGTGLNALTSNQTKINNGVQAYITWALNPVGKAPALPLLQAEDVIRGWRFDVYPSSEPAPAWRSLHQRTGRYLFGNENNAVFLADEGTTTPGATAAPNSTSASDDLYVHEAITRWAGWSLAAPRPGMQVDPSDHVHANRMNPADSTVTNGQINAQLSASFQVVPGTLPKLRYGEDYRYRARAVDLAGNSLPPDVQDASTATPPVPHFRYEPVASPVMAETAPLGPGEGTLLVAIRNYNALPPFTPNPIVTPNGKWLFPPKASEVLVEQHGMLDVHNLGQAPNRGLPPDGSGPMYTALAGPSATTPGLVDATLLQAGASQDPNNSNAFYIPTPANPTTPWLPDPLSRGVSITGFPGTTIPALHPWLGGPWPGADPLLLELSAGAVFSHSYSPEGGGKPSTQSVVLVPGQSLDLAISSFLTSPLTLGVWWWIEEFATTELERLELLLWAERGQLWMITPYKVVRLVHAVLTPLVAPIFHEPVVERQLNSVLATIEDRGYIYDPTTTSEVDATAVWVDLLDDPSDPTNVPDTDTTTTMGHAFKANVPDPGAPDATDIPMQVIPERTIFPIIAPGVVHNLGDTKHHTVNYTATATSRFAEFFRTPTPVAVTLTGTTPDLVSPLGFDVSSVVVTYTDSSTIPPTTTTLDPSTDNGMTGDYLATPDGNLALVSATSAYSGKQLAVSYIPSDTNTGGAFPIQILSTAVPKAPKVLRVSPAWITTPPSGSLDVFGISAERAGGWIRVYLDRPWWDTGNDELLGVVTLPPSLNEATPTVLPDGISPAWVTTMGLDPISVSSLDLGFPISPSTLNGWTTLPSDIGDWRSPYSSPAASLPLIENPAGPDMWIWPYAVNFDPVSNSWYADINISDAVDGPPPGYFVRLALVRFQPYSIQDNGVEISHVTLASFCQPVPDRNVSVVENSNDKTNQSVLVTVTGQGYYGFRPINSAQDEGTTPAQLQYDSENAYALHPDGDGRGNQASSTIVVEVQVQDTSSGLTGDLSWIPAPGLSPVMLQQSFNGTNEVSWNPPFIPGTLVPKGIELPYPLGGGQPPMRLRISELDYYPFLNGAPSQVDTRLRRPFVVHIPIN